MAKPVFISRESVATLENSLFHCVVNTYWRATLYEVEHHGAKFRIEKREDQESSDWETEIHGDVKFDHCMNWIRDDPNYGHFCEPEEAGSLGACFQAVYDMAADLIPGWME